MAQVKIYALRETLTPREAISNAIHASIVQALKFPLEKRFQRFFPFEPEDYVYGMDRTSRYMILEISMFEGRSVDTKKNLIRLLFANLKHLGFAAHDLEITIFETPKHNWGIRGVPADELALNYKVEI